MILMEKLNELEKMGWQDITHSAVRAKPNFPSRDYFHPEYGITIRFDKGQPGMPGFKGVDHYQIYNPISGHHRFCYLDIHGEIVGRNEANSHILLKKLNNICVCNKD